MTIAARLGGGDAEGNPRLRAAVAEAKANNMPKDNIERAIKRGTGEIEGAAFEEITYEGYGPGGVAILVECATDNRNRTVADIRNTFNKNGGRLGESGSVAYLFNAPTGVIAVSNTITDEDTLISVALHAGADDVKAEEDVFEVYTSPGD